MDKQNRGLLERFGKDKVSPTEFYAVKNLDKNEDIEKLMSRKRPRTGVWREEENKTSVSLADYFKNIIKEKSDEENV